MEYANRMHKVEHNERMSAAIARCKANHPKVNRLAVNRVQVENGKGKSYVVTFAQPCADLLLAECNCAAGLAGQVCYHIAAALACPTVMPNALMPSTMESRQADRDKAVLVKPSQYLKATKYGGIDI